MDLGLLEYLLKLEKKQKDECKLLLTRAEGQKEVELNKSDKEADLVSGAEPIPMDQIFDFYDEIFSDELLHSDQVQTVPDGAGELLPIPNLVEDQADTELLEREQGEDETLATIRAQGNKNEKGYFWSQGILRHLLEEELGQMRDRIVLPVVRRNQVLQLAHSNRLEAIFQ